MSKHKQWHIKLGDGRVVGPISSSQLKKLAATGKIGPETLISLDGEKWYPASQVKGLTFEKPSEVQTDAMGSRSQSTSSKAAGSSSAISDGRAQSPEPMSMNTLSRPLRWVKWCIAAAVVGGVIGAVIGDITESRVL